MVADRVDRMLAGGRSQSRGALFEKQLAQTHKVYRERGIAWIDRIPVPTAPARGNPRFRVMTERTGADFRGQFGPQAGPLDEPTRWWGRAVLMEAKSTDDQPSLGVSGGGPLKTHQLEHLATSWTGWRVPVAVLWQTPGRVRILLPESVRASWAEYQRPGGRRSIEAAMFRPVPTDASVIDWLGVLRGWLEEHER